MNSVGWPPGACSCQWITSSGMRRHVSPSSQYHSSPALVLLTLNFVFTTSEWSQHFLNGKRTCAALVSSALRYHCCTSNGWLAYSGFQVAPTGDASAIAATIDTFAAMCGARTRKRGKKYRMGLTTGSLVAASPVADRRTNPIDETFVPRAGGVLTRGPCGTCVHERP